MPRKLLVPETGEAGADASLAVMSQPAIETGSVSDSTQFLPLFSRTRKSDNTIFILNAITGKSTGPNTIIIAMNTVHFGRVTLRIPVTIRAVMNGYGTVSM